MRSNLQGAALADGGSKDAIAEPPAGKPLSHKERRVYEELNAAGGPMKAYALLEKLHDEGIRAPMTVYRALDALIDRGLVKKVASLNAFAAVQEGASQTVGAYVTCRRCGKTREVSLNESLVAHLLAPAGVAVDDVFIEAFGDCRNPACKGDCENGGREEAAAGAPR